MRRLRDRAALACVLVVAGAGLGASPSSAHHDGNSDAVLAWNANAGDAAVAACISPIDNPLHESRMYAMSHAAIHDALNAIDRRSRPYAYAGSVRRRTSPDAAIAAAARGVMVTLLGQLPEPPFPPACRAAGIASVEADYAEALASVRGGRAKARGIELGQAAAAAILNLRATDGSDTPLIVGDYPEGAQPGEWRFTPERPFAFAPGWGEVTPFVLRDGMQLRPGPPYPLGSRRYAADFNEIKALGGDGVTTPSARTAEQTEIARFWVESSPLSWNRLARGVARRARLDLWEQARLFGLINLAMADGYVASFATKYQDRFWRPVTAIRAADTDGNRDTTADPSWTPLVVTPPIPDHDSAHAVEGGAASRVLERFFGTDHVGFPACSRTLPEGSTCTDPTPVYRRYRSFSEAAEENGLSRILVGFHFRKAVRDGIDHGRRIADLAVERSMRPER